MTIDFLQGEVKEISNPAYELLGLLNFFIYVLNLLYTNFDSLKKRVMQHIPLQASCVKFLFKIKLEKDELIRSNGSWKFAGV